MFSSIVVGTDGSPTAAKAVNQSAELAQACGATVHLVSAFKSVTSINALSSEAMLAGATPVDAAGISADLRESAEQILARSAEEIREKGVKVEVHAAPGDPAQVLIEVAEAAEADLIIVGNKGMSGSKRFVLGSVPNKLSHHAPCAVLIAATG
jgi:nucleotide-binding universal stress UspA family protein